MSPSAIKTIQLLNVALFAFVLGRCPAHFTGTVLDWMVLTGSGLAMVVGIISLTLGFWKSNA
jgi:hypothetical protein